MNADKFNWNIEDMCGSRATSTQYLKWTTDFEESRPVGTRNVLIIFGDLNYGWVWLWDHIPHIKVKHCFGVSNP